MCESLFCVCVCVCRLKEDNATKCEYVPKNNGNIWYKMKSILRSTFAYISVCCARDRHKKELLSQSEHCRKTKTLNSRNDTHKNLLASCKYNSHKDNYNTNKNSISSRIVVLRARDATVKLIASIFCEK